MMNRIHHASNLAQRLGGTWLVKQRNDVTALMCGSQAAAKAEMTVIVAASWQAWRLLAVSNARVEYRYRATVLNMLHIMMHLTKAAIAAYS